MKGYKGEVRDRGIARRIITAMVLGALMLLMGGGRAWAVQPTASPLPGSTFQAGDGNQDPVPNLTDWKDVAGSVVTVDDPNADDTAFTGGSKEEEPGQWQFRSEPGGISPGKDNIRAGWNIASISGAGAFLYASFLRESTTGDTYLTYELNQSNATWVNAVGTRVPCRTTGDVLISFTITPSGDPFAIEAFRWTTTTRDAASGCGALGTLTSIPTDTTSVQGAANFQGAIANYLSPAIYGSSFAAGSWAETGVNLTKLIPGCFRFVQVQLHSRTSTSVSSQLQDIAGPRAFDLANCGLAVEKSGPPSASHGAQATYTYAVTNPAPSGVTGVTVADDRCAASGFTGPVKTGGDDDDVLEFGETWTYRCTMTIPPHQDGEQDPLINTVTVRGTASGEALTATDTFATDILDPQLAFDVRQRLGTSGAYGDAPLTVKDGDTIGYELRATNPGDTPFTLSLSDPRCDAGTLTATTGDTNANGKLDPGETFVATCTHLVVPGDPTPFANTAVATGTTAGGGTETAQDTVTATIARPQIAVDEQVRVGFSGPYAQGPLDARLGDTLGYRFTVTNPGNVALSVTLSDPRCDAGTLSATTGDTNSNGKLDPGETFTATCTHVLTSSDPSPFTNTVTATGTDASGTTTTADDSATVNVVAGPVAAIAIDKTQARGTAGTFTDAVVDVGVGQTIAYRLAVTNPGTVGLTSVGVTDPRCDAGTLTGPTGDANGNGALEPGETFTFRCSRVVRADDPSPLVNTATASGTKADGSQVTASDEVSARVLHPALAVDKQIRRGTSGAFEQGAVSVRVGETLSYRFIVTNTGDAALTVVFTDPRCDSGTLTAPAGDANGNEKLDTDETWVAGCTHIVTSSDPDPLTNTVRVDGTDAVGTTASARDSAVADLQAGPLSDIAVDVTVRRGTAGPFQDGPVPAAVGDTVTFRLAITNPGETTLSNITISDPRCDTGTLSAITGDTDGNGRLDPGETFVVTCTHVIQASDPDPFVNTATVTGTPPSGANISDAGSATVDVVPPPVTSIAVEKTQRLNGTGTFTADTVTVRSGDRLDYRVDVTDPGATSLSVDLVDDQCDAGTLTGPSGDTDGDGRLDPGETWRFTCSHRVTAADPATITNVAMATGTATDGSTDSSMDSVQADSAQAASSADTQLVKTASPTTVPAGGTTTYTLKATNAGTGTATTVRVDDDLPAGTSLAQPTTGCTVSGQRVSCAGGTLAPGASVSFALVVRLPVELAGRTVTNTAQVSQDQPDADPADNAASANVTVGPVADLGVTKRTAGPLTAGSDVSYVLTVTNGGPSTATGVVLDDPAPKGLTYSSAAPGQGTCTVAAGSVRCALGPLAVGGSTQVTVVARVAEGAAGSTVTNVATVAGQQPDPRLADNTASVTDPVSAAPAVSGSPVGPGPTPPGSGTAPENLGKADLSIVKSAGTGVKLGQPLRYTIAVANKGPAAATRVVMTDTLGAAFRFVSVTTPKGTCSGTKVVRCEFGTLDPGERFVLTLVIVPTRPGALRNVAGITSATPDPVLSNNTSTVDRHVTAPPTRIVVTKRALQRSVLAGSTLRYRIRARNAGEAIAYAVRLCDKLPRGMTLVSSSGGVLKDGTLCWSVPSLAAGAARSFELRVRIAADAPLGTMRNRVVVSAVNVKAARASGGVRVRRGLRPARGGGVTG